MRLKVKSKQEYVLRYEFYKCGYGAVFLGLLRAMADDYGSLVTINHESRNFADVDKDIFYIHVFEDRWTDDTVRVA